MEDDILAAYRSVQSIPNSWNPNSSCSDSAARGAKLVTIDLSDDDDMYEKLQQLESPAADDVRSRPSPHEIPLEDIAVGPIPESIPAEAEILPVAVVHHFSGHFSVADTVGQPVAPGSLLADEHRNPVTRVIDLFGPVECPKLILRGQIPVGTELYAVVGDAVFPDPDQIEKQYPGTDASNRFDEADNSADFSDDEEERRYRMEKRQKAKKMLLDPCDEYEVNYENSTRNFEKF